MLQLSALGASRLHLQTQRLTTHPHLLNHTHTYPVVCAAPFHSPCSTPRLPHPCGFCHLARRALLPGVVDKQGIGRVEEGLVQGRQAVLPLQPTLCGDGIIPGKQSQAAQGDASNAANSRLCIYQFNQVIMGAESATLQSPLLSSVQYAKLREPLTHTLASNSGFTFVQSVHLDPRAVPTK